MSLSLLRMEGAEEGRDAALSVLLHITDADRIIDLELTAPKRLSNVIFLSLCFFLFSLFFPLRCDVFDRPFRYGLFGTLLNLLLPNHSPNLRFVPHNSHCLLSPGRASPQLQGLLLYRYSRKIEGLSYTLCKTIH